MKNIGLILVLLISSLASAQKYFTKTGLTEFKASVEAFEPVEAKNESTTVILNTENGDMAALLFVKAFHFKVALMQEHFNENYMDSDKYPKATFKGNIDTFSFKDISDEEKEYDLKGVLTVHGKAKDIATKAKIKKIDNQLIVISEFNVSPQDFDIDIPRIVRKKIAESINLKLCYELIEKK